MLKKTIIKSRCLTRTSDNSKYFLWSNRLRVKEFQLYIHVGSEMNFHFIQYMLWCIYKTSRVLYIPRSFAREYKTHKFHKYHIKLVLLSFTTSFCCRKHANIWVSLIEELQHLGLSKYFLAGLLIYDIAIIHSIKEKTCISMKMFLIEIWSRISIVRQSHCQIYFGWHKNNVSE